jgi:hypothetical protein
VAENLGFLFDSSEERGSEFALSGMLRHFSKIFDVLV